MKRFLLTILFLPLIAFAQPVSFDFSSVSLITFAQATFKSILHRDYVISPEVVAMDRKITVSVKNLDTEKVSDFVENILLQQGIKTVKKGEIYYLEPLIDPRQKVVEQAALVEQKQDSKPESFEDVVKSNFGSNVRSFDSRFFQQDHMKDDPDSESRIYSPQNRPTDFLMNVINAGFAQKPAQIAGSKLMISGKKEKLDKIFLLLEQLDMLPHLVDVSASWIEVSRSSGAARGVSLISQFLGAKIGVSLGTVSSGSAISLKGANFQLIVDALNTDQRFNQISNSRVVGDDYKLINLIVGDETPTVSSTGKDNSGNAVQNVVYRQSGLIVEVLPKVLGSGKINMTIDGQISSFKTTLNGVTGSPTLIKRQVKTEVTVNDGEVLLIGGLNDSLKTDTKSGLFFLPDSFSTNSGSKTDTDLVLVLSAKTTR